MKAALIRMVLTFFIFLFCTTVGIFDLATNRVGLGVVILLLSALNLPIIYFHWYVYKKHKEKELKSLQEDLNG
jgi:hypothetical protein